MRLLLVIFISLFMALNLFGAAFEETIESGSVRARGMGDAFESVAAGIDSVMYNPAGTAYQKSLQILTEFGKPIVGMDDESSISSLRFGIAVPFSQKPYLIFLNYIFKGLTLGNENKVMRDGSFAFLFQQFSASDFYHERLFTFNLSKNLSNLFEGANLSAGVNINIFNRGFIADEDTAAFMKEVGTLQESTSGLGLDLGILYDFSRYIRLSFVMANLLEPNISMFNDGSEYVNRQIKGGLSWRFGNVSFMQDLLGSVSLVQISRDSDEGTLEKLSPRGSETIYKIGTEFWQWEHRIGIRFGYKSTLDIFTGGLTFKHTFKNAHSIIANYALNYPLSFADNIKHYFSLNYEFDFPDYFFDYRTEKDLEESNKEVKNNFQKGLVILKYKTLPSDNLYNISIIHYGNAGQTELLKTHNKIDNEKELPPVMEIPYDAKSFITYKVEEGDTLESISMKLYNTTDKIDKIRRYNNVPFSKLKTGQILVIPMGKEDKEAFDKYEKERAEKEKMQAIDKEMRAQEEAKKKADENKLKEEQKKKKEEPKKQDTKPQATTQQPTGQGQQPAKTAEVPKK